MTSHLSTIVEISLRLQMVKLKLCRSPLTSSLWCFIYVSWSTTDVLYLNFPLLLSPLSFHLCLLSPLSSPLVPSGLIIHSSLVSFTSLCLLMQTSAHCFLFFLALWCHFHLSLSGFSNLKSYWSYQQPDSKESSSKPANSVDNYAS